MTLQSAVVRRTRSYTLISSLRQVSIPLLSAGCAETFNCYKSYTHLREMAVIDALLELLTNGETIQRRGADIPEMVLSEYKY